MMFEGTSDQALMMVVLAAALGGLAARVLLEVRDMVRHRRLMARLAAALIAAGVSDDAGGPPEVPPAQVRAGCDWHPDGEYHRACVNCLEARPAFEVDGLARGLLDDHELGEHEDEGHVACRACQVREVTVLDAGEGLMC